MDDMQASAAESSTGSEESVSSATTEPSAEIAKETPEGQEPQAGEKKVLKLPENLKPKPEDKERFRGRISDLVAHRKQVEERNRYLEEQLARYLSGQTGQPKAEKTSNVPDGAPKQEDFDSHQEYVDAMVDYKIQLRTEEQIKANQEATYREYRQEKRSEFERNAEAIIEQVPAWKEDPDLFWNYISNKRIPASEAMVEAVMESGEVAPYMMLWLAANRKEAAKMYNMPPRAATVAIGRLAMRLEQEIRNGADPESTGSPSVPPANPGVTPRPVPQIRGGSPGNMDTTPSDKDDVLTWFQKEAARQRKRNGNDKLPVYIPRRA